MGYPANISQCLIVFTATPESPVTITDSLQVRKYKFRDAQTLAEVTQLGRSGAGMQAQGTVPQSLSERFAVLLAKAFLGWK